MAVSSKTSCFLSSNMLPKSVLFQVQIFAFNTLSFYWKLYILVPPKSSISYHHYSTKPLNILCPSDNCLKRKGFGNRSTAPSQLRHMGQWSEPAAGSTFSLIPLTPLTIHSATRKRSSLEATKCSPPLWLFQVNHPSPFSRSTRELLARVSLKSSWYFSSTRFPPFFSLSVVIRLKSPPII